MAGVKITDLPIESLAPDAEDLLVIVNVGEDETRQITVESLLSATQNADVALNAERIRVATTGVDATYYPLFSDATTGYDSVSLDVDLTYNPSTNTLTAGFFAGNGSLLTGVLADSAFNATNAIEAQRAQTALAADSAINASNAQLAEVAKSADLATNALAADSAINASNALLAETAQLADIATLALAADSATVATSAIEAQRALFAFDADSALNATNAVLANFALASANDRFNIIDSANGVRIFGDTKIDSDLFVKGSINVTGNVSANQFIGDGSLLTNIGSTLTSLATKEQDANSVDSVGPHYFVIRPTQTGYDSAFTSSNLVYDPSALTMSAPFFSGDGSALTNVAAVSASAASTVAVSTVTDSAVYYLHLGSTTSGNDDVNIDTNLTYNPLRDRLRTSIFATDNWDIYESAGSLLFAHNGVKKVKFDSAGNIFSVGTLTESTTL